MMHIRPLQIHIHRGRGTKLFSLWAICLWFTNGSSIYSSILACSRSAGLSIKLVTLIYVFQETQLTAVSLRIPWRGRLTRGICPTCRQHHSKYHRNDADYLRSRTGDREMQWMSSRLQRESWWAAPYKVRSRASVQRYDMGQLSAQQIPELSRTSPPHHQPITSRASHSPQRLPTSISYKRIKPSSPPTAITLYPSLPSKLSS